MISMFWVCNIKILAERRLQFSKMRLPMVTITVVTPTL